MTPTTQSYRLIPLSHGVSAIVDAADYEWLNQWKWHALKGPNGGGYYACRTDNKNGRHSSLKMHRVIVGLDYGDKRQCDHIDRNPLNNSRANLRIVTHAQNSLNRSVQKNNTSGFNGVTFNRSVGKYQAVLQRDGKKIYLGLADTAEAANLLLAASRATRTPPQEGQ